MTRITPSLLIIGILCCSLLAADKSPKKKPKGNSPLRGVNCFVNKQNSVSAKWTVKYRQGVLYFSNAASRATYRKSPKKYVAWANYQLVQTTQYVQQRCPLSGEEFDKDSVTMKVGKVSVRLLCAGCKKEISKLPLEKQVKELFDNEAFKYGKFVRKKTKRGT